MFDRNKLEHLKKMTKIQLQPQWLQNESALRCPLKVLTAVTQILSEDIFPV